MKKILALLFVLVFVTGCGYHEYNQRITLLENQVQILQNKEIYDPIITDSHISLMRRSVVIVNSTRSDQTYKFSGFAHQTTEYIDGDERDIIYVWSVAHGVTRGVVNVFKDEETEEITTEYELLEDENVTVTFMLGVPRVTTFEAEVVDYDLELDLALLKVDVTDQGIVIPDVRFANERLRAGEPIYAIGHPGPRVWALTEGLVGSYDLQLGYRDAEGNVQLTPKVMETTMDVSFGYSGSPVFDPTTGIIYGYASRMTQDTSDALVFPIEYLIQFAVDNDYEYALPD